MRSEIVRQLGTLAAAGVLGLLVAACVKPGDRLADHIRAANSPVVREVFVHDDWLDGPEVILYLRSGATEAQAEQLWCEVIEPAGGSHLEGDTATTVWDSWGWTPMAQDTNCGAGSSPLPTTLSTSP